MPETQDPSQSIVQAIGMSCEESGLVKQLRAFKKSQHKVPDSITPATSAFLSRLCAEELEETAEALYQSARSTCGYKRRELSLSVQSPGATLSCPDFTLDLSYGFANEDPSAWRCQWVLSGFKELDFLKGEACNTLFEGRFTHLFFRFSGRGCKVEDLIDAVEALENTKLRVDYPSDCNHCILRVEGVPAQVRIDGAELSMEFPSPAAPAQVLQAFIHVREAFVLSGNIDLAGLLG